MPTVRRLSTAFLVAVAVAAFVAVVTAAGPANASVASARAAASLAAMERLLFVRGAGDYRETVGARAGTHAWPFSQALAAHIAVKSVLPHDAGVAVRARLRQLERFDDGSTFTAWPGGHVYLDDNEWLAQDLLDWNTISHDRSALLRAQRLFDAVVAAWDTVADHPCAGGVRWTTASMNQDRNTVSTANGALVGLRLYRATDDHHDLAWSKTMLAWVERCLRGNDGLYWDHIDSDGNVDRSEWSYNQGSMLGAYLELYRATGDMSALQRAQTIGDAALQHFAARWQNGEPPEFAALFFRNLLQLAAFTGRTDYVDAAEAYGDAAWTDARNPATGLFAFGRPTRLLDQAALVQLYAALATAGR